MSRLLHESKKIIHRTTPGHLFREQKTKRIVRQFADRLGFVYFGAINRRSDDYRLLRGVTVSTTHEDNHYTVGTFDAYDVAMVIRRDTLEYPDRRLKDHFWTIMTFDLHTNYDVPNFYLTHQKVKQQLLARFTQLIPIITNTELVDNSFATTYTIYAALDRASEVQALISQYVSREIAKNFRDMSIEVSDNTLYLYAPEKHPSPQKLEQMLTNGVWLAKTIDAAVAPTAN